jgi:hypothetical protein
MTIQDLGALGEFLSSIVVLVTLGYLAFQTRQNTMAIGAQLDATRASSVQNIMLTPAISTELGEAIIEDRTVQENVSDLRRIYYWNALFFTWQWQFVQGRQGLLKTFSEPGLGYVVGRSFTLSRGMSPWWEATKSSWLPEFVAWVEEQRAKAA